MVEEKYAIISQDGRNITYSEVKWFCAVVSSLINKKKLILVRCKISPQTILMYVAALKCYMPVMMVENERDSSKVIEDYIPEYIWQEAKERYSDDFEIIWDYCDYVLLKRKNSFSYEIHDDLALLLSTSGSTGSSKFVRISYRNIECNTKAIVEALQIKKDDVAMVMLPLSYTYGLSVINTYLYMGATLLVPSVPMIHKEFWDFFIRHGGNVISGVPYSFEIIKRLGIFKKGLSSLRLVTSSGGKLSYELEKYMLDIARRNGFHFASMYGQTEATARISCHFLDENPQKIGSVGKTIVGVNANLHDDEIVCTSSSVALGYAQNYRDLTKGDEWNGILRTGDIGEIDKDGYIYIKGRLKRIAKINGHRMSLDELENFCFSKVKCPCMIVEKDDIINIYLEGQVNSKVEEDVLKLLVTFTGFHKNYFQIHFVELLPRNKNGKLLYGEIVQ